MDKKLERTLGNWEWRMDHLYRVIDIDGTKVVFRMNEVQRKLWSGLHHRNLILKARQRGVTTFFVIFMLDRILFKPNVEVGLIAHGLREASKIFRQKVLFAYDNLPASIRAERPCIKRDAGELVVDHGNGNHSSMLVSVSMRSSTLQYLHISEFGKICAKHPDRADEIVSGSLNAGPKCVITIESTAEGRAGHFYEMCQTAQHQVRTLTRLDYKFFFFSWWDSPSYELDVPLDYEEPGWAKEYFASLPVPITDPRKRIWYVKKKAEQKGKMKQEFPSTPAEAFEQALAGAYYAEQMNQAYTDGRVRSVSYSPGHPVHTAWDIGHSDATSIWFFQVLDKKVRLLRYVEAVGRTLRYFVKLLGTLPYVYGRHVGPHDMAVVEWGGGKSRLEFALTLGIQFEMAPRLSIDQGIDAVREVLPYCEFDATECERGLNALSVYRKEWDDKAGVWSDKPCHDWSSHPADAFRTLALSGFEFDPAGVGTNLIEKGAV